MTDSIPVLVIEDDPIDFKFLEMTLRGSPDYKLHCVTSAADGEQALAMSEYSLLLLDLSLPDSAGLQTAEKLLSKASCPVVVLSGFDDEAIALEAVKLGAQDYLVKGHFNAILLTRTLRYAIERHQLINELDISKQEIARQREQGRLQTATDTMSIPSQRLKSASTDAFEHAVEQYRAVLLKAMDQRIYKMDNDFVEPLKRLALQLGSRQALARDIVDIHNQAMLPMLETLNAKAANMCNEEARYLLIGLFGHLCSYYQNRYSVVSDPEPLDPVFDSANTEPLFLK